MKNTLIKIRNLLALSGLAFLLVACGENPKEILIAGKTMGTTYHVKLSATDNVSVDQEQLKNGIESLLMQINSQMSTYKDNSEISLFNQSKAMNEPFPISKQFAEVVAESIRLNKITRGGLDITVGPLVNLWGFGPEKRTNEIPTEQEVASRLKWTGIANLKLNQHNQTPTLSKAIPELYIDLSAIAKGYAVDQVANYLNSVNISNYLVEIGGEIFAKGKNAQGKAWRIAIEKPQFEQQGNIEQIVELDNLAMATSGDYRNFFEKEGKRFSHEIDPNTGYPIQHNLVSITVIDQSCMTADGLATGLIILGAEKSLEIAEQLNIPLYLIIKTDSGFEPRMSPAFQKLLSKK